jgi:uncharacterized protein YutE (UPF0331/DUF86 family)
VVIDVAGELSAREGHRFEDYTTAVRNLSRLGFPADVVSDLSLLPGFRNVLVHEYVGIDYNLVMKALDSLDPIEVFLRLALQKSEG